MRPFLAITGASPPDKEEEPLYTLHKSLGTVAKDRSSLILLGGIVVYAILKIVLLLRYHQVQWDEAVFLTMGKYLVTGGAQGYWEALRPPLLPVLLSGLQAVGNPVVIAELLIAAMGAVASYLLYDLLKEYVRPTIAALAAVTLLFSTTWFWYGSMIMEGVPSAFLILLAVWLHRRKRFGLSGMVAAGAFLTRFPAGLVLVGIAAHHAYLLWREWPTRERTERIRDAVLFGIGFAVPVIAWLILNAALWAPRYGLLRGALYPILAGAGNVFTQNLWLRAGEWWYYLWGLLLGLPISVLALFGVTELRKKDALVPVAITGILALVFFSAIADKQLRFLIIVLPGILALVALGADRLYRVGRYAPTIIIALLALSGIVLAVQDARMIQQRPVAPTPILSYYTYAQRHPLPGLVAVSDPGAAWQSPNPAIPTYFEFLPNLRAAIALNASTIFFVPFQQACDPGDAQCAKTLRADEILLENQYVLVYQQRYQGRGYYVFRKGGKALPLDMFENETGLTASS